MTRDALRYRTNARRKGSGGGGGGTAGGTADTGGAVTSGQTRGSQSASFQGYTNRTPAGVLAQVARDGETRAIKTNNLANAKRNILEHGTQFHVVKIFKSGGIKDGWHHLNAMAQLQESGQIKQGSIRMEIHD